MTDDEQKAILLEFKELRDAFLEVPPGSPKDARPLLEDLRVMARNWRGFTWAWRIFIWGLPVIAGLGASVQAIRGWFAGGGL